MFCDIFCNKNHTLFLFGKGHSIIKFILLFGVHDAVQKLTKLQQWFWNSLKPPGATWACYTLFDFNRMPETDEWRNQMATLPISNSSLLWKHPECFISTELSQWNILHHSHLWSRRAIKQGSMCFVSAGEDQSSSWRIGSWLGWMKTPSMERHQLFWLADFMPCTSRWPLIGCPYCSPVTLR